MRRAIISILSVLIFAAILTFFPASYFEAILLYLILFFVISIALSYKTYRRGLTTVQEISKGKPIIEIDEKEINKLIEKDKELYKEYRKFTKASLMPLLTLPIFIILATLLFPVVPHVVESSLGPLIGTTIARFLGYVTLFGLFAIVSIPLFKLPMVPRIVRSLRVYETGIVIDKTFGFKAPLYVSEYRISEERKFIEFKLNNQIFRVYYKDIKELDNILSKLIKPLKQ